MPDYNNPKDMEPSKLDSLTFPKEYMYLTSLDYFDNVLKKNIKYHLFRDDNKVIITCFYNKIHAASYTEENILSQLKTYGTEVSSIGVIGVISFWQNVLQAFKGSEQFLVCECGCKKEFPNSNVGHFRYCNYMKSNAK